MDRDAAGAGDWVLLRSTFPNADVARQAAAALLEQRLACCVHWSPITAMYRWQGDVVADDECLLEARTTVGRADAAMAAIRDDHPYDVPMVEVIAVAALDAAYAAWGHDCLHTDDDA